MRTEKLVVAVAAAAVAFGIGAAPSALAAGNVQTVGIEELLRDPNGTEIAYTVTKIVPSGDPVAYPVGGRLYEATVMAGALRGIVNPVVPFFNARSAGGANYPALVRVSTLSAGPLFEGSTTTGKVYFDVVGDPPNSVVYDNGPEDLLTWVQAGDAMPGGATGGGSTGGGSGSEGVMGSTGPNDVSPSTTGGESGNTGEEGTEGGGGNLDSGGGAGAPNGDTGD
ncbi:hypothetical protein MARA_37980 [Mycolicibacterium arabiense]|uniref:MPT63-like domain-containing protein n=1 Tax=Mycolicibacterium arabiense TaxID=1286181 RepID=A0A7I7S1N3_9MYCO|nr:DUF1942 domain-containing protein [Mycolicibacterium arabiense]MCV7371620.1 DUF1942 domain-containing protein [Mycolicibacterium arabiense]BBY50330.1 hypothetical protein MARA_37980 [Mycolicibacterium arabiense]